MGIAGGTALAAGEVVNAPESTSSPTSRKSRLIAGVAIVGVLALGALLARELFPHHAAVRAAVTDAHARAVPPPGPQRSAGVEARKTPSPGPAQAVARAVGAEPSASAPAHVPFAATVIAKVAADPQSFFPSHVFAPPAGRDQVFNFEPLPPFNSTTLKRTRTNPAAWELDAMHGPKLNDLGPEGSVRQAALVKDSVGNETPWYAIDSGPLAPAYAVMQGNALRVMSRAFMVENRATLPADVAASLGAVD